MACKIPVWTMNDSANSLQRVKRDYRQGCAAHSKYKQRPTLDKSLTTVNRRRQVKDVDFGLVFPAAAATAPLQPVPSNRRTPQPDLSPPSELPAQRSSRRTPANREQPVDSGAVEANNLQVIIHSANDANTSAKRRKLDTDAPPSSSARSTRSSQPRPDIYTIHDDVQQEPSALEASNASIEESTVIETIPETIIPPPRTARTPSRTQEEITESPIDAPGSGHRTRVSVLEASIVSSHLQAELEGSSAIETPIPQNQRKRKRGDEATKLFTHPSRSQPVQASSAADDELDELSPEQPERRGWRKVVEHSPELEEPVEEEEAEAIDDEQAAVMLKKNRGRRISRHAPEESPDLDSPVAPRQPVLKKQKGKSRPASSPAKQSHPKQPSVKTKSKMSKKPKVRIGSPIPVTVHRLSRAPLYDEDELHADILNAEIPRAKRGGVNAIDVLSQICQEIIGAGLDTLEDGCNRCEDPILRREYKTKLRAVEAFGDELQTRLLDHVSFETHALTNR
jgi:hypothetical protein